jgi:hypothetical protein
MQRRLGGAALAAMLRAGAARRGAAIANAAGAAPPREQLQPQKRWQRSFTSLPIIDVAPLVDPSRVRARARARARG